MNSQTRLDKPKSGTIYCKSSRKLLTKIGTGYATHIQKFAGSMDIGICYPTCSYVYLHTTCLMSQNRKTVNSTTKATEESASIF